MGTKPQAYNAYVASRVSHVDGNQTNINPYGDYVGGNKITPRRDYIRDYRVINNGERQNFSHYCYLLKIPFSSTTVMRQRKSRI
jgi:hypothetical protein